MPSYSTFGHEQKRTEDCTDSIQPAADDIQGFRLDDIHGYAVMHTVFNGILRYSACTTDE
ncbi:MAG: hypothetical protein IJE25_01330 [Clostridia bacterium]|nr:hypothetical protein [Clostridia bacterium]